jgi:transcriptional regulator with XRE-family HTH domain
MSKRKGQAKLASAIVEAIRNAKERRGIVTALATQYGVSHSMISMIRAGKTTEERFKPDRIYAMHGSVLNAIWREIYLPLITDDGTPMMAIKSDCRRDMAQRLGALLESNAIEIEAK